MTQSQKLIPTSYRLNTARSFIDSFGSNYGNSYYFFVAYDESVSSIPVPFDNSRDTVWDVYRNMLFGKKVANTDVKLAIPRYTYEANSIYAMYDDTDESLYDKIFYVMVPDGSFTHVFKCMNNLDGETPSTIQPNIAYVNANDEVYEASDGYQWKYMYSADSSSITKFATSSYFPLIPNSAVSDSAVDGAIDVIKVEDGGSGYYNYTTGTFRLQDIRLGGNSQVYGIANSTAISNGYFTGCYMHITDGPAGIIGQYRKIADSRANGSSFYVVLDTPFTANVDNTTKYEVYPAVEIIGDGTQSTNAAALAVINAASSNAIHKIKMLDRGEGYKYVTAVVNSTAVASTSGFRAANVRPILPPRRGHGYDAAAELGARYVSVGVNLANSEGNTVIASNDYRQIGLLKNPLFANVKVNTVNSTGTFLVNEMVYGLDKIRVAGSLTTNLYSSNVSGVGTQFNTTYSTNDYIYILSSDGTTAQLTQVNSVTNSTFLVLKNTALFTNTTATPHIPEFIGSGKVVEVGVNTLTLDEVRGTFENSDEIIGRSTGAVAVVNSVSRSNQIKGFNTFIQMFSYDGVITAGSSFSNDEIVRMTNNPLIANAVYHAIDTVNGGQRMYVTKQTGIFNVGGTNSITGQTSESVFRLNNKYYPEIVYGTGEIIYIENIDPVTRAPEQTETFKLILEF